MVKKGKYKLFSYLVENHLIYYKSISKYNRIVAFALLISKDVNLNLTLLNKFLRKNLIQHYSIQLGTGKNLFILNFEDSNKEGIIKTFNLVQQKLGEIGNYHKFLKGKVLEEHFLTNIFEDINSNTSIMKDLLSFIISSEKKSIGFDFYEINLNFIKKKTTFISNFLKLINDLGRKGFLIFHFTKNSNENIKFSCYFVEIWKTTLPLKKIEEIVNTFFHCELIKRYNMQLKEFLNFIWRIGINDSFFLLNDYYSLFSTEMLDHLVDISDINDSIEYNLTNHQIKYLRLSKNLLLIEQNCLFLTLPNLDSNFIQGIIEKYYPKYFIYILLLNNLGYESLLDTTQIKLIKNVKIINLEEVQKINYEDFKNIQ
ncbi:MAG: hypothetical protein ACFE9I_05265 [Candidatus Hermodarchaeota archaeon]